MENIFSSIWDVLLPTATGTITAVVSWLTTRRKYEGELAAAQAALEDSQLDNLNKAMASYDSLMERYAKQIGDLIEEIDRLRADNKKLREENVGSLSKIDEILAENRQLRKEVEALRDEVTTLKNSLEKGSTSKEHPHINI